MAVWFYCAAFTGGMVPLGSARKRGHTYREAVARLFAEALDLDVELEDSLTINLAGTQLAARYPGG
jgi:hypothetical protein